MTSLIKYKTWNCASCGFDYQGAYAYINNKDEIVCVDCLTFDIPDMGA